MVAILLLCLYDCGIKQWLFFFNKKKGDVPELHQPAYISSAFLSANANRKQPLKVHSSQGKSRVDSSSQIPRTVWPENAFGGRVGQKKTFNFGEDLNQQIIVGFH